MTEAARYEAGSGREAVPVVCPIERGAQGGAVKPLHLLSVRQRHGHSHITCVVRGG